MYLFRSSNYCQTQTTVTVTANVNQKSPTIPNIILTGRDNKFLFTHISFVFLLIDVDSSKLDLSKELGNDFSNTFDGLIDPTDLHLTPDDFVNKKTSFSFIFKTILFTIVFSVAQCA